MLDDLQSGYLDVIKIPGREGGYVRCPISVNVEWYQDFCGSFTRSRKRYPKFRTIIKRCDTISALKRIAAGDFRGVYAERLLPFIEDYAREIMGVEP